MDELNLLSPEEKLLTPEEIYKKLDEIGLDAYKKGWVFEDHPDGTCTPRGLRPNEKIKKYEKMLKEEK